MNRRQAFKNLFTLAVAPVAVAKALAELPVNEVTVVKEAMVDLSTFRPAGCAIEENRRIWPPESYYRVPPEMLDDIPYFQSYLNSL